MLAWLRALFARLFGTARPPTPELAAVRPGPTPPPPVGMQQLIGINGAYPQRGGGMTSFTLGMVESFVGTTPAYGAPACQGETLPIIDNQQLLSVIGLNFGGDGQRSVGLPDLRQRVAIGGDAIGTFGNGTLTMTWLICADSAGVAPLLGMIVPFGGNYAPAGWAICDGSLLSIRENVQLFQVIGVAFGGNPAVDFQLPNLIGAAPIGAGGTIAIGNQVPGPIPGLGLNFIICTSGVVAPASGDGGFPANAQYVGQVVAYAAPQIPEGWALCDGSLIPVSSNPTLFALIGYNYGGDGRSVFALPDLRGRMLPGI